mgnify:FL=1|tara:strand:+ start:363 stop:1238 length:876 start_codon:yes stop_codon:yes gene_type:complete
MKIKINKKEELEEVSSMAGGNVSGFAGPIGTDNDEDEKTEALLRRYISEKLRSIQEEERKKEMHLRKVIRKYIAEAKDVANPHPSTGINKLRDAFRKGKPTLKSMYQQLTTSAEQRESFTNHLLSAFVRLFDELDGMNAKGKAPEVTDPAGDAAEPALQAPPEDAGGDLADLLEAINVQIKDDMDIVTDDEEPKPETQVEKDIAKSQEKDREREEFSSGLEGMDTTGRNQAFDAFRLVQSYFSDAYLDLANEEDKKMFKDWCLYNLDLLMSSYEKQLEPNPERPEISSPEG